MRISAGLFVFLLNVVSLGAQTQSSPAARIDSLLLAQVSGAVPRYVGIAAAVIYRGDTLVLRGYGMADLEHRVPVTPATVFNLASVSKQMTASVIVRLAEQGRLELDAPARNYLPGSLQLSSDVTVRHLLAHLSGIPNLQTNPEYAAMEKFARLDPTADQARDSILAFVSRHPLLFKPGTRFDYSNTGYDLLGFIIDSVAGRPYASVVSDDLLQGHDPQCSPQSVVAERARPYSIANGRIENAPSTISPFIRGAAASFCASLREMIAWSHGLHEHRTRISDAAYRLVTTPAVLSDSTETGYGFGLYSYTFAGHHVLSHAGSLSGLSSDVAYFPDDSLTIVLLGNSSPASVAALTPQIARIVLGLPGQPLFPPSQEIFRLRQSGGDTARVVSMGGAMRQVVEGAPLLLVDTVEVSGDFSVSTMWTSRIAAGGDGVGIAIAGPDGSIPVEFMVRRGFYRIRSGSGAKPREIVQWKHSDGVTPDQTSPLIISIVVAGAKAQFFANENLVASIPVSRLSVRLAGHPAAVVGRNQRAWLQGYRVSQGSR